MGSADQAVMVALTEKITGLTYPTTLIGTDGYVQFLDSSAAGGFSAENAVFIGFDREDGDIVRSTQTYAGLGGMAKNETVIVNCAVSCFVGGSADTDGELLDDSDAQNSAKQNAYAILAVIENAIVDDKQLLLVADPPVNPTTNTNLILWSELSESGCIGGAAKSGGAIGRSADITFSFTAHCRLYFS
jgi:hypothetical protein